ncbi:hypothetical protein EYF80_060371 [Liparis tanakae]|uniref:Uncharacterized protein n=1 Tax=Liparis tanakae TaxID=230148 RepID=A0A4Z2EKZ2_9TELE|nr:hypothetical protein EYF80_060371 [Liparis tanakae]
MERSSLVQLVHEQVTRAKHLISSPFLHVKGWSSEAAPGDPPRGQRGSVGPSNIRSGHQVHHISIVPLETTESDL